MSGRIPDPKSAAESRIADDPPHTCHAFGCDKEVHPSRLMCPPHWRKVPKDLQNAVWAHYKAGQEVRKDPTPAYLDAADAAVRAVAVIEGRL